MLDIFFIGILYLILKLIRSRTNKYYKYNVYLKSNHWRMTRFNKLLDTNFTCEKCGHYDKSGRTLNVHHLTYANIGHEKMSDLQTLCIHCHKKVHAKKNRG